MKVGLRYIGMNKGGHKDRERTKDQRDTSPKREDTRDKHPGGVAS